MHDPRLLSFYQNHAGSSLPILIPTLRAAARAFGHWTEPDDSGETWQHTVGFEASLFGITAWGNSEDELARNWLKTAHNLLTATEREAAS